MKLTEEILEALAAANPDGDLLYLQGQLDRKLYEQVDAALSAAGGRWDKRRKAHVFPGPAWDAVKGLSAQEQVTTASERKQGTQFFPTPPDVADMLISGAMLAVGRAYVVLEPSAGEGAIASRLAPLVEAVDCIELDESYAAEIRAAGYARNLTVQDFLTVRPDPVYDRVIMNPPFTKGADVAHVAHALRFVKPGGRLVSVMSASVRDRKDKASVRFRAQVDAAGGWFVDVPAGAFEASGTPIRTVIVVIPVLQVARPSADGEPVRVTTDSTAGGMPLFDPAVTAPGVYVHWDAWTQRDAVFRFAGKCIGCGRRTWAHDHGGDDVRGLFGDWTCVPLTDEDFSCVDGLDVPEDVSIPRCAVCWNEREAYERALRRAIAWLRTDPFGMAAAPVIVADATPSEPAQLALFAGEQPAA